MFEMKVNLYVYVQEFIGLTSLCGLNLLSLILVYGICEQQNKFRTFFLITNVHSNPFKL
jgi:hypothetical protein